MTIPDLLLGLGQGIGALIWLASVAYLMLALWRLSRFSFPPESQSPPCPAMTVLKPLCGAEPGLETNLRSFCNQAYPAPLQIIFGARSAADPALTVARKLRAEHPNVDIDVVVGEGAIGRNPKVGNLANMAAAAKHPIYVISDSDTLIEADCLRRVGAALSDPSIGAVTCLFRGAPADPANRFDRLGELYTNGWTLPSAIVAAGLGPLESCDGPLTAIRRSVLEEAGGFASLSHFLGDDHELGQITVRHGLRVQVGPCLVETRIAEASLRELFRHEVRWARTTRAASPLAYAASGVTWSLPLVAALLLLRPSLAALLAILVQVMLRIGVIVLTQARFGGSGRGNTALPAAWTIVARETLCCAVWAAGFFGDEVSWRGRRYRFSAGGRLQPLGQEASLVARVGSAEAPL